MTELVATRGLPASGKSTWAFAWVANDPVRYARVSRDDFRAMLFDATGAQYQAYFAAPNLHTREAAVTAAQQSAVRALLESGRSVVVDDTNLKLRYLRAWAELARDCGATFRIQDFTDVPVEECLRRDVARGSKVGESVIRGMAEQLRSMPDVLDALEDGETGGYLYEPNPDRPFAWIVDIDGTVALMNGRAPYDYTRVSEDMPYYSVMDVVHRLSQSAAILFVSGREGTEQCRLDTVAWLDHHEESFLAPGGFWSLNMRKEGDSRADDIVKMEILRDEIAPYYYVLGVLDDRNRVVRMWRRVGLLCLQVAEGAF